MASWNSLWEDGNFTETPDLNLKLVVRRWWFYRNSVFFQANSLRLFWPQNGLGGQIWPHHWFSLGQFSLPTKFQVSRASPWPSETRWTKRERETDNYYTCGTASLPQVKTVDIHGRFSVNCFSHHNHNTNLKSQSHMYGELNKSIGRALQGLGNLAGAALESP